ncbi:MAG: hypothetical protein ACR2PS_01780 [Pseudomonadales bacterium]
MDSTQARVNRYKLLLLFGIPFIIMAGAYLVYTTGIGIPKSTSNKGILINPPLQIGDMKSLQRQPFPPADNKLWFFLVPGGADCDGACRERLYQTRQIRTALGKHTHRVQRIYLSLAGAEPNEELRQFLDSEHADLQIVNAVPEELAKLITAAATPPADTEQVFYVADPQGFIMLYYDSQHSGKDTLADMKFLLKFSQE